MGVACTKFILSTALHTLCIVSSEKKESFESKEIAQDMTIPDLGFDGGSS